jgi:hypothetical protein
LWLLAAGCEGGADDGGEGFASFGLVLDGTPSSDARVQVDILQVTVDRLWFEGEGPAGQESVALDVDAEFSVLAGDAAMEVALRVGAHEDASVTIESAVDTGGVAIVATGRVLEPDDDEVESVPFRVEVETIDLVLDAGTVHVPEEGSVARVLLRPTTWLEGLPVDDDALDVGPGSGPTYDRLLSNIRGAVTLDPPEPVE